MELSRNARTMPPSAAIADANENANSLATITSIPSAAAARSLVRTAISRRPLRPASHVGDHDDREHRHDQHEDRRSARGMVDRSDVVAEQVGLPTCVPWTPPV